MSEHPERLTAAQRFERIFYFFPLQLVIMHVKKSQILLIFWLILIGFVAGGLGQRYGVPYLFLAPEYMNQVGFMSFFILGLCCGIFIMTYNIASYTANASRFEFIATLNRPFLKYSGNNLVLPLLFLLIYMMQVWEFDQGEASLGIWRTLWNLTGLLLGVMVFLTFNYIYFFSTNKNVLSLFNIVKGKKIRNPKEIKIERKWWQFQAPLDIKEEWRVETYMSGPFHIRLSRHSEHYPRDLTLRVFNQNHMNATRFQLAVFATLIVIGLFREIQIFQIPAGASIFLIMSMFLILTAVLKSWLRGWGNVALIVLLIVMDQASKIEGFSYSNMAYGLNYNKGMADFSDEKLNQFKNDDENYKKDFYNNVEVLNKWRLNNSKGTGIAVKKPKLVIVNCSGGGSRSALWTYYSLSYADSALGGELMNHTQFITGSSGGMLGAAYLRELQWLKKLGAKIELNDDQYIDNIGKDLLNPVAFTIAINDLFIRFQDFSDGNNTYNKDRGYIFEKQFVSNCGGLFAGRRLGDYADAVELGIIPEMVFAPTIVNDGRRMLISSKPVSYLTYNTPLSNVNNHPIIESIEFRRLFEEQAADSIWFTSVLRMNATFPWILPNVTLPSEPPIEVMDAGLRDNFGLFTTIKYIYTFRNWLATNTSGVVIIETRDKFKEEKVADREITSKLQSLVTPIGSLYGNLTNMQSYTQDDLIQYMSLWYDGQIDIIPFQLNNSDDDKISLSWHLTAGEKDQILKAMDLPANRESIARLQILLGE